VPNSWRDATDFKTKLEAFSRLSTIVQYSRFSRTIRVHTKRHRCFCMSAEDCLRCQHLAFIEYKPSDAISNTDTLCIVRYANKKLHLWCIKHVTFTDSQEPIQVISQGSRCFFLTTFQVFTEIQMLSTTCVNSEYTNVHLHKNVVSYLFNHWWSSQKNIKW